MNECKMKKVSEQLEVLYENNRGVGMIAPTGFKLCKEKRIRGNQVVPCEDGRFEKRNTGAKNRIYNKSICERYFSQYVPDEKYVKTVKESGFTEIFNTALDAEGIYKRIRQNIKNLREYYNMSQSELAKEIDITRQYIGQIESGEKVPTIEILARIAVVFQTNVAMLISVKMPNHFIWYSDALFKVLNNKSEEKQAEILKKIIEYAEEI